jgi:hypothetical protein
MIKKLSASHLEIQIEADAYFEKIGHCSILKRIKNKHLKKLSESAMIKRFRALRKI